ncbi:MAG: hypothetical protein R3C03_17980 [Pirellulaceae bacterium]
MKTVQQVERLTKLAEKLGYEIRYEDFGGVGGGRCEFGNRRCLFIDLSLSSIDQLEQLRAALLEDPSLSTNQLPTVLIQDLGLPTSTNPVV